MYIYIYIYVYIYMYIYMYIYVLSRLVAGFIAKLFEGRCYCPQITWQ